MTARPSAPSICRALGGFRAGSGFLCRCPCAGHGKGRGDRHPSLSVSDGRSGLVVHCFAGCAARDVLAAVDALDLAIVATPVARPRKRMRTTTTAEAVALWRAGVDVRGTPGEAYLAARGLPLPPPTVRFLARASFSPVRAYPALVAALQAPSRAIVAVQLTFLDPVRPAKASVSHPRRIIGPAAGAALRLAAAARHLGLAEGFETGHAAMILHGLPVWCALGCERLPLVVLPAQVEEVTIFADSDPPGLRAAQATRAAHPGLTVHIRPPDGGDDYAALLERRANAARRGETPQTGG